MSTKKFLDCCGNPDLTRRKTLYEAVHDAEALLQCVSCDTYWFYRFSEYVNWSGGPDDLTSWYTPLTPAEAESIEADGDRHFLLSRPSWMDDNGQIRKVPGAPDRPRS